MLMAMDILVTEKEPEHTELHGCFGKVKFQMAFSFATSATFGIALILIICF